MCGEQSMGNRLSGLYNNRQGAMNNMSNALQQLASPDVA